MSGLPQRFQNMQLTTERIASVLQALPESTREAADTAGYGEVVEKTERAVEYAAAALHRADPLLTPEEQVTAAESALSNIEASSNALRDSGNGAHANQMVQATDALITSVGAWVRADDLGGEKTRNKTAAWGRAAARRAQQLDSELDELRERLMTTAEEAETAEQQLQSAHDQRAAALNAELDQLKQQVASVEASIQSLSQQQSQQFAAAQQERQQTYDDQRESFDKLIDDGKAEIAARMDDAIEHVRTETGGLVEQIQQNLSDTNEVVGLIASTGTAGEYAKAANAEKQTADTWRLVAVGLALGAVLVAMVGVVLAALKLVPAEALLAKLFVTVGLGAVAAYAGKQSGMHRKLSIAYRQRELELKAFGPFIQPLAEEQREEARRQMVERYFGQEIQADGDGGEHDLNLGLLADRVTPIVAKRLNADRSEA